jgi:hypothetical protein
MTGQNDSPRNAIFSLEPMACQRKRKGEITNKTVDRYFPSGNLTINRDAGYLVVYKLQARSSLGREYSREEQVSEVEYAG